MNLTQKAVRDLVMKWAMAQAENLEIEGSLVIQCGATHDEAAEWVARETEWLDSVRKHGICQMRTRIYEMSTGEAECKQNGSQMNIMQMFARNHLGWAREGVDDRVRKALEQAERDRRKKAPKLVAS